MMHQIKRYSFLCMKSFGAICISFYSGMTIRSVTLMRLTRDAEVELEDNPKLRFEAWFRIRYANGAMNRSSVLSSGRAPTRRSGAAARAFWTGGFRTLRDAGGAGLRGPVWAHGPAV